MRLPHVVGCSMTLRRLRRGYKPSAHKRFSTRPGIVSPLFIASVKRRYPPLRTLAMAMLNEQGHRGRTDGRVIVAISARLAALETSAVSSSSLSAPLATCDVLESQRVSGFGVMSFARVWITGPAGRDLARYRRSELLQCCLHAHEPSISYASAGKVEPKGFSLQ